MDQPTLSTRSSVPANARPAANRTARRRSSSSSVRKYSARIACFSSFFVVAAAASLTDANWRKLALIHTFYAGKIDYNGIMPRWRYAPWRRYVMQAVMWVILGATVALAALVTNEARRASRVGLNDPRDYDDISVPLPSKWTARTRAEGNPRIVVQASESEKDSRGRVLTISRDVTDVPLSPMLYLARNFNIPIAQSENAPQRWTAP